MALHPHRRTVLKFMAFTSWITWLSACFDGPREQPGDQPNPRLATMLQARFELELAGMRAPQLPALIAQAPHNAWLWLAEIDQVVAHCSHGPGNRTTSNKLTYDITLRSGERIDDVYSGQRCRYDIAAKPLVMRVRFQTGRVAEVFTDGRERAAPPDATGHEVAQFAQAVLRVDRLRRPARYHPPTPTGPEIAREWERR